MRRIKVALVVLVGVTASAVSVRVSVPEKEEIRSSPPPLWTRARTRPWTLPFSSRQVNDWMKDAGWTAV